MLTEIDQWIKLAAGVVGVVAAIIGIAVAYLSIKKTRLEIHKLRIEAARIAVAPTLPAKVDVENPICSRPEQQSVVPSVSQPTFSGDPIDKLLQWSAWAALFSSYKRLSYLGTLVWCCWISAFPIAAVFLYSVVFERESIAEVRHLPVVILWFGFLGSILIFPIVWLVVRKAIAEFTNAT